LGLAGSVIISRSLTSEPALEHTATDALVIEAAAADKIKKRFISIS